MTDLPAENTPEETKPEVTKPEEAKPALTLHIHSWATPIVGLIMLVLGLLGGYFARPLVSPLLSKTTPTPTVVAAAATSGTSASQPGLKEVVVAQVKHFRGDENAPVTIVEFSDYQ